MSETAVQDPLSLPDSTLDAQYDTLFYSSNLKQQLATQILLTFSLRTALPRGRLPIHGIILLVGPPGTGKTTLARAVASKAASLIGGGSVSLLEVDPHALTGAALGKSQKAVMRLFSETIGEYAAHGPLIVLLDEVETMAASRQKLSMDANPIDVHRATDAVLAGVDLVASKEPNVVFICTSNFPDALDSAFLSRIDHVAYIGLPDKTARGEIIKDTLNALAEKWTAVGKLATDSNVKKLVELADGMDGRAIRKGVLYALSQSPDLASNPNMLSKEYLESAFDHLRKEHNE